jgi:hypothetical protein
MQFAKVPKYNLQKCQKYNLQKYQTTICKSAKIQFAKVPKYNLQNHRIVQNVRVPFSNLF